MQLSIDVFHDVVHYLDTHEESLRIKKLIFCICKKYWENDPNILNSVSLEDLINELVQLKPSNEQLTFSVYKLVKTLNRPKVYAGVATIIIDRISQLYSDLSSVYDTQLLFVAVETPDSLPPAKPAPSSETLLKQIVTTLENHRETARIKKLMFAACKNNWENDAAVIDKHGLKNIILEIQQNNPNLLTLKQTLNKIAENINKKTLYLAIADIILTHLEALYDTEVDYQEQESDSQSQILHTQIIHLQTNLNDSDKSEQFQSSNHAEFATSIIDFNEPQLVTELHFAEPAPLPNVMQRREYDPFEIRLEILQYTNPLRAKILLFSILFHPWDRSGQDWSTLRSYTLEDMIEQLLQSGKSLKDIETQLQHAAKSQMDNDANVQTANILVQALQRIF